jgi:hypothetical protein
MYILFKHKPNITPTANDIIGMSNDSDSLELLIENAYPEYIWDRLDDNFNNPLILSCKVLKVGNSCEFTLIQYLPIG